MNKLLLGVALLAFSIPTVSSGAAAQTAGADRQVTLSVPSQDLSGALRQLAEASGLQLVYETQISDGKTSPGTSGTMTVRRALSELLAGSGLGFRFSGDRTVVISADAPSVADGVRSVGVVNVEGVAGNMLFGELVSPVNGTNGSRDVEATEGTGSYTTGAVSVATKIPTPLRDTPQSVSVITKQQIIDQNLISVRDILEQLPGITATPGPNGEEFNFFSRGFAVTTFTFDGGAPVSYAFNNRPVLDMSEFDSVQIVRGADGLFGGYGDPGGVVNLVRKKPLDHRQITFDQTIGLYKNFREELDVSGPLTSDHHLRARIVAARQDQRYFYNVANSHRTSVYGALDYDLGPRTLLDVGGSYNRDRSVPNQGGLPRYKDGNPIDFPIATCLCPSFNYDRSTKTEAFATLSHQFNTDFSTKFNATYNFQRVDALYYGVSSSILRNGNNNGTLGGFRSVNPVRQYALDYTFNGGFNVFGRHQVFVLGANYSYINGDGGTNTNYPSVFVPNIFTFDPYAYTAPAFKKPFFTYLRNRTEQYALYGNARIELFKPLHVNIGLRYNYSKQESTQLLEYSPGFPSTYVARPRTGRNLSDPSLGFTLDVLRNFTVYGSRQPVYRVQLTAVPLPGNVPPPPITGRNDELGVKYQSPSKRFNASVAFYRATQNGFLTQDFGTQTPSNRVFFQDTKSQGVDVEATGELLPGLQISASYAYNDNSIKNDNYAGGFVETPKSSFAPKHKVKLWTVYRPPAGDLHRLVIGGGLDYQSRAFNTGFVCSVELTNPNAGCPFFPVNLQIPFEFVTKSYTTFSAKIGYSLSDNVEVSLVGKNLANKKAYQSSAFQNTQGYNFYIPPFGLLASVHLKF